jgi:isocitrate dehydrogenase
MKTRQGDAHGKTLAADGGRRIPDTPVIAFMEGDGIGPDIWAAARLVLDAAGSTAYGDSRRIQWEEVLAGEKAYKETGEPQKRAHPKKLAFLYGRRFPVACYRELQWLSKDTLEVIRDHGVAIKGPLTTPAGKCSEFAERVVKRLR